MSTVPHVSTDWQTGFLNLLPSVMTHAKLKFRNLPAEKREEAIQETIAAACAGYQTAATQGKLELVRPGPLADFAVRHVRTGRHVGGKQDTAHDLLSPVAQKRHGVRLHHYYPHRSGDGADGWKQVAIEDRKASIPDLAAFKIDFQKWLEGLTRRDQKIVAALASGEGTGAVAGRFGLSPARVSQLRREYEQRWQMFQGEAKFAARAS